MKWRINKALQQVKKWKNCDLVSLSVDGSHEDKVNHKAVRYLLTQKDPTVVLTAT